jgi:hypothetical protein
MQVKQRQRSEADARRDKRDKQSRAISRPVLPGPWQVNAGAFLLLVGATLALYASDLRLGFFFLDDPQYVLENQWIKAISPSNLWHIVTVPYYANYSPFHLLSYMLDYAVAGANAVVFHLSSNIWGGLVAGFVFCVALALTGRQMVAVAAGALFVFHPAHVEAIAWISSRKDLVAAAFALPSFLAYLYYRQGGPTARRWYVVALLLFMIAVAGKLSVAGLPAVFLVYDVFVEKRPLGSSLPDKVPFLFLAIIVAWVAAGVQPSTGRHPEAYVLVAALIQSIWLFTGFGSYVIYRVAPESPPSDAIQVGAAILLLAIFGIPLLLRRRAPRVMLLIYWILFGFIPTQALSFFHPVTDRYLFLPSVAAVILLAWGIIVCGERFGRGGLISASAVLGIIAVLWAWTTLAYLREWHDPRSVWYLAAQKSSDSQVYWNLGIYYQEVADGLGTKPRVARLSDQEARRVALGIWAGDPRLPALLAEWNKGQHAGPIEGQFQDHLRALAWAAFDRVLSTRGNRIMPSLYFRRGLILSDRGDLAGARREFTSALDEAGRHRYVEAREEMTVKSQNALGIIAWTEGQYTEAMRWLTMAEEEQNRAGRNWLPDLTANRKRLEGLMGSPQTR